VRILVAGESANYEKISTSGTPEYRIAPKEDLKCKVA
jgi:hypothetical protein